jgi:hypothetical protein
VALVTFEDLADGTNQAEIFGIVYPILSPEDFSLTGLAALVARYNDIYRIGELTPATIALYKRKLDHLATAIMPDLPDSILARLTTRHKEKLLELFNVGTKAVKSKTPSKQTEAEDATPTDWGVEIPRLKRFYGGSDNEWWDVIPIKRLRYYIAQLPVIQAQESLMVINAGIIAQPAQNKNQLQNKRKAIKELQKRANPTRKAAKSIHQLPLDQRTAMLLSMGIGVELPEVTNTQEEELNPNG